MDAWGEAKREHVSGCRRGSRSRRLAIAYFRLQFSEPPIRPAQYLRGAALVPTILGDGAARDGPLEVVQEPGERSSRL